MGRPEITKWIKKCDCGKPTALKCTTKNGAPSYYLACSPIDTAKQCSFFKKSEWAQREAQRLRELEEGAVSSVERQRAAEMGSTKGAV
jgi:hypothetical protein